VPAPQLEQKPDPAPEYCPEAQPTQVVDTDDPVAVDDVPAPQLSQAVAPASVWYWPEGQLEQLV